MPPVPPADDFDDEPCGCCDCGPGETDLRMACLGMAIQAGARHEDAVSLAEVYLKFVTGEVEH